MPSQLPLPLAVTPALGRADFIEAPGNAQALAFIDSWPHWPVAFAALHGPSGAGKSHLAHIWSAQSGTAIVSARDLAPETDAASGLVIEDWDGAAPLGSRDRTLFTLMERATPAAPLLLTGLEPPAAWKATLPDLTSRFAALVSFPLWAPDDVLLAALAVKLFDDRQLRVPEAVIARMLTALERTPAAIRTFIAEADARSLAEGRAINLALIREMLSDE